MSVHDALFSGSECNSSSKKFGGLDLGFFCFKPYSFIVLFRDAGPALAVLRVLFSTCSSLNAHIHTDDQKRGVGDRKQVLYFSHVSLELRTVDCGCVYFADETVMVKEQNQGGR